MNRSSAAISKDALERGALHGVFHLDVEAGKAWRDCMISTGVRCKIWRELQNVTLHTTADTSERQKKCAQLERNAHLRRGKGVRG